MTRTQIINKLIEKIKAKNYLEIGVNNPINNFDLVNCLNKTAVDPSPFRGDILSMTSDEFFSHNTNRFDVVFIDGLHHADQVERDIYNSLRFLNQGGYIVCHDMNPTTEWMQHVPPSIGGEWTGDCWKAWVKIKCENANLNMYVVDTDYGVGIIKVGKQQLLDLNNQELTYENFSSNKKEWLNLISVDEFCQKFKS